MPESEQPILGVDRVWFTRDEFIRHVGQMMPNPEDRVVAFKVVCKIYSPVYGKEISTHEEQSINWPKQNLEPAPTYGDPRSTISCDNSTTVAPYPLR